MHSLHQVAPPRRSQHLDELLPDLARLRVLFVNAYFVGIPQQEGSWVLVDAGLPGTCRYFLRAARERFGEVPPEAIILTHGHFDHVGTAAQLADHWNVPIYAHRLEMPYVTGQSSYPPADPTVGGGLMALSAPLFRRRPYDLRPRVQTLPDDGTVPGLPGWRWIHTPGHTHGHVSLLRDSDRALIAGDAFVTVQQESLLAVLTQWPAVHGPPSYFTSDWQEAGRSVRRLAELEPELAATGHGVPIRGAELREGLHALAERFRSQAVPTRGRYVDTPAVADESGVQRVPPPNYIPSPSAAALLGVAALAGLLLIRKLRR